MPQNKTRDIFDDLGDIFDQAEAIAPGKTQETLALISPRTPPTLQVGSMQVRGGQHGPLPRDPLASAAVGAAKGLGRSVTDIANLTNLGLRTLLPFGEKFIPPEAYFPQLEPQGTAENVGFVGERIAEFLPAGVAAVKGIKSLLPSARKISAATEKIFRAANPSGSKVSFRANLETAVGDLAEIERITPTTGKGGMISPDKRIRSVAGNIDTHLQRMFQQERAIPIAKAASQNGSVMLKENPQVMQDALDNIGLVADHPLRGTLTQLASNPRLPIPIQQADELARVVNKELLRFEKMAPSEQATAAIKSSSVASLKRLDKALSAGINGELNRLGLPDLTNYERRFAALSNIRDVLKGQMNAAEKVRLWQRVGEYINIRSGVGARLGNLQPSAGRLIQKGMKGLAESEISATRSGVPEAAPARSLLPERALYGRGNRPEFPSQQFPISVPAEGFTAQEDIARAARRLLPPAPVNPTRFIAGELTSPSRAAANRRLAMAESAPGTTQEAAITSRAQRRGLILPQQASPSRPVITPPFGFSAGSHGLPGGYTPPAITDARVQELLNMLGDLIRPKSLLSNQAPVSIDEILEILRRSGKL